MRKIKQAIYKSDAYEKYANYIRIARHHPIKHIKQLEDVFGRKFNMREKMMLLFVHFFGTKESRKQKKIDKILKW